MAKRDVDICFRPTKPFKWFREDAEGQKILVGAYQVGLEYTCTTQAKHDELYEKMQEWAESESIVAYPRTESPRQIKVRAEGIVEEAK